MSSGEEMNGIVQSDLNFAIQNASDIITKNYLDQLESYEIVKPSFEDIDIDISSCGKFYHVTKLILNKEESFLDKLTTIVNVVSAIDSSFTTIIKSDGIHVDYYMGIISKKYRLDNNNDKNRVKANIKSFNGALLGNLAGIELKEVSNQEILECLDQKQKKCYSSISGIATLRNKDDKEIDHYVQGIENLVDSLKGLKYTIVMIADPIKAKEITNMKSGYELLHTNLSTFLKQSVTLSEGNSASFSQANTSGIVKGITHGITMTQGISTFKSNIHGSNESKSKNLGLSLGGVLGPILLGGGVSFGKTKGTSSGISQGTSKNSSSGNTLSSSNQVNQSRTNTSQISQNSGKSIQINYENRTIKTLLDKIDLQIQRLDECENFSAFNSATYVIADNKENALTVASNYNALMRGQGSNIQATHINTWDDENDTTILSTYLKSCVHPKFKNSYNVIVTPASIVNGNEIAIQVGMPKKSINGVTVIPMAPFGRNTRTVAKDDEIFLGNLVHMGCEDGTDEQKQKVNLDIESLCMHTFITGSTGSGKSTAIYSLLDKLKTHRIKNQQKNVKFMVIEPAKGEYKNRFGNYDDVYVYGTNFKKTPLLKINPFSFPEDVHVLEHIDKLIEIFNVCWPMYAAMPSVLKDSIERAYVISGWDLDTSECKYKYSLGKVLYPTFIDVLNQINEVMNESQYSLDSKGDYKGALCTRIKSLTNGLYSQIFTTEEISNEKLFDENVIIDLSRIGSTETKALIMGLLVMKLQEYRMSTCTNPNQSLQHVTVLEEAHHLLKKTSTEQSQDGANLLGKSVEILANSIAEMRTYGEGFIIADQAPSLMDMSVIRNTNTKIILRLPDESDRNLVGKSANLDENQISELSRLHTFTAAVYQNDWLEPVLCNIDVCFVNQKLYRYEYSKNTNKHYDEKIISYLLLPIEKRNHLDKKYIDSLKIEIWKLQIPTECKITFMKFIDAKKKSEIQSYRGKILYEIFNSNIAFTYANEFANNMEDWYRVLCESLNPSLELFCEIDRKKIVAALTKERAERLRTEESKSIFKRFIEYI